MKDVLLLLIGAMVGAPCGLFIAALLRESMTRHDFGFGTAPGPAFSRREVDLAREDRLSLIDAAMESPGLADCKICSQVHAVGPCPEDDDEEREEPTAKD